AATTRAIGGKDAAAVRAAAGAVSILYIGLTAGVAALVSIGPFAVSVPRTLAWTAPFAVAATAFGAAREAGVLPWDRSSVWLRRGVRTGSLVVGALLAFGSAAVGVAFAVRGSAVADTLALYGSDAWAVALLSLLYLPNLAVWAVAYLCGPGFAVGTGTAVQAELVELGPLPAFPVFAAVPAGPLPASATILIGLPLMLASVFGVLLTYRSPDLRVPRVTTAAILAAAVAAALLAALAWLSGGAAGTDLLAEIGPDAWKVAAFGGVQILIGLVGAALVARLFAVHRRAAESELVRRDTVVIPEPAPSRDDALRY
ncbi:cell division protein PerM, partial [Glycomyces tenuis]